jgi:hypothetical protein
MNTKILEKFVLNLPGYYTLNEKQQENISKLREISKNFLDRAKIRYDTSDVVSSNTIVLESGHQPNFLPHAGTWKKAFLLADFQKRLMMEGNTSIAFFGFPDLNLSTTRLLSRNQIPALNKKGVEAIGFRINDADRLKSFCRVKKPSYDKWQNEINTIEKCYVEISNKFPDRKNISKTQFNQILEILWNSYELADNFAELNGYIFAKICHEILNIDLLFFFYSDMEKERLFIDESKKIFQNVRAFNQIYNRVIIEKRLAIPPVVESHVPFWYHCECGGKINLLLDDSASCKGMCPVCAKEYHLFFDAGFKNLHEYYDKMDFNAVSRNIVMSEGLGDTLFLSGVGGSLQYGAISDQISQELTFHRPISLAWQSKDFYLGMTHAVALQELKKIFLLPSRALLDPVLNEMICQHVHTISQKLSDARQKKEDYQVINSLVGMRNQSKNWPLISQKIFSNTSSIIDIFMNHDFGLIIELWKGAINNAEFTNNSSPYLIKADINYHNNLIDNIKTDELPLVYQNIRGLEVE